MRRKLGLMMGLIVLFCLAEAGLQAASPESGKQEASVLVNKTITADVKHLTKSVPPPKTAKKDAIPAEIEILYPVFTSSAEPKSGVQAVNKAVQHRLLTLLEGKAPETVEGLMDSFSKEYEEAMNKAPEFTGGWSLKFEATLRYSDEDFLALEFLDSVSSGGAHGDSKITYQVFSLKTGEPVALTTVVPEKKMKELNQVAEKIFRQVCKMKPTETFEQAGFSFEREQFSLNQNFLVSKAGLAFCFNPSEIGPYSKGIIELVIPWAEIKTIVQPDGLAGRFLTGAL